MTFTGVDPSGCLPFLAISSSASVADVAANVEPECDVLDWGRVLV